MSDELRNRADARLETALRDADRRDPRPYYRTALRHLREHDPEAFQRALRFFEEELVPAVADEADPLEAWLEYGRRLAAAFGPGRTVELDSTGRERPVPDPGTAAGLVLHIPDDDRSPVLVLRCPRDPSRAQTGALELLVEGRQTASLYG
ncbi:MAG: hypothetical protein GWM90_16300 [Gemmatimonadetes bacterium]|nr:hypothetical protein [Gemmatimonadota bacterium]NIQ55830.1 hypothetical protein [Gemmatimonadota bacterium]NIU76032.1 hypothetical protein [Gammaproteobacteria bacterium]NIX45604.1 hypothetical protein [Gemmatimonadota bacterium]NIY09895.1 hypothetical protein [Gemmatimonadota bacterium]